MENKFSRTSSGDSEYVDFAFWQLIVIGIALIIVIVSISISASGFVIWMLNFLYQLAIFTVLASILASLGLLIFKKGWGAFFSVILLLCSIFSIYDSIRAYNFRKDQEAAYQKQLEMSAAQQQNGTVSPEQTTPGN